MGIGNKDSKLRFRSLGPGSVTCIKETYFKEGAGMREVTYNYKNLQIPGGGYVTGFLFHPTEKIFFISEQIQEAAINMIMLQIDGIA